MREGSFANRRLRAVLAFGIVLAAGETVAALAVGARELELFVFQALIALAVGLAAFAIPLSVRVLTVLALTGIGGFHTAFGLHDVDGRLSAFDVTVLVLLLFLVAVATWTCTRTRAGSRSLAPREVIFLFAAGYLAQALWSARFLIPQADTEIRVLVCAALASVVAAPIAALLAARQFLSRRRSLGVIIAMLLVALPLLASRTVFWRAHHVFLGPWGTSREPPDVILIVLDTVRADRLSLYGYPRATTPHLERFAERATVYERAQSQGIWTLPGHASLFTGLYPSEHETDWKDGVAWCRSLRPEAVTMAERFALAGYRTASIAANRGRLSPTFGLTQGFEWAWSDRSPTARLWIPALGMKLAHLLGGPPGGQRIGALERNSYPSAVEVNALALEWLERTQRSGPRFLFLNYMEAHDQLRLASCAAPRFGDGRSCIPKNLPERDGVLAGTEDLDPANAARLGDWYDTEIACLDHHVGELFDELERRGLLDGSLVAVTSDHGHLLGEHGGFDHRAEVWQELLHVPLLLKRPGQRTGSRCEQAVETADLAFALPWLAGLDLSLPVPPHVGRSDLFLRSHFEAPLADGDDLLCPLPGRSEPAVSEAAEFFDLAEQNLRYATRWTAILDGPTKYFINGSERIQVADEVFAAGEQQRTPTEEELARARALLDAWRASLLPPLGHASPALDEEADERLRLLEKQGYVGR